MAGRATYVYCVVERARRPPLARVPPGVPEASEVTVYPAGRSLWLIAAQVPLRAYAPRRLRARLQDLEWVSRLALAHETLVEHFAAMRSTVVLPMKLFTIFSSPERAVEELRRREPELQRVLARIRGCEEWGIRISSRAPAAQTTGRVARTSGAAFLAAKRAARDRVRESAARADRLAGEVLATLARLAREVRRREPPDGALAAPVLDAVLLVPVTQRTRLRISMRRASEKCRRAGADLALTGPWPAYHFVGSAESA